ncbi:MAG: GNAT family N-acetyltransferase [Oscillatoriophycideae cyanobacterium NC_groundwater_1537_Pr4_S-0.65um_50_18]|nr:GNAT family N-acetyltransferase [Oscillatoriophycideae cyanobacterium NC_groundwater_1537_Pr4_S-0.65um_50_18]
MPTQQAIQIRAATLPEDVLIAEHFYQMWLDNDVSPEAMVSHWQEIVLQFIKQARQELGYQAFVAQVNDRPVGSVGCQRFAGLYPNLMATTERCDGYIWGVYVEPAYRHQGIATQLTKRANAYLKAIGCTHAVLNASPSGQPLYAQLGFTAGNLMRLDLR